MIKVQLSDFNKKILKNDLEKNDLSTLLSIDCNLKIIYHNKVIFNDWICPIELYAQIKKWDTNANLLKFEYSSEDNSTNPIFSICYNENEWKFYSFNEFITTLTKQDIKEIKDKYLIQLQKYAI